jgi:hypothetical protein
VLWLIKEQHVQTAQEHDIDVEEVHREDRLRLGSQNARQSCPDRVGTD